MAVARVEGQPEPAVESKQLWEMTVEERRERSRKRREEQEREGNSPEGVQRLLAEAYRIMRPSTSLGEWSTACLVDPYFPEDAMPPAGDL